MGNIRDTIANMETEKFVERQKAMMELANAISSLHIEYSDVGFIDINEIFSVSFF